MQQYSVDSLQSQVLVPTNTNNYFSTIHSSSDTSFADYLDSISQSHSGIEDNSESSESISTESDILQNPVETENSTQLNETDDSHITSNRDSKTSSDSLENESPESHSHNEQTKESPNENLRSVNTLTAESSLINNAENTHNQEFVFAPSEGYRKAEAKQSEHTLEKEKTINTPQAKLQPRNANSDLEQLSAEKTLIASKNQVSEDITKGGEAQSDPDSVAKASSNTQIELLKQSLVNSEEPSLQTTQASQSSQSTHNTPRTEANDHENIESEANHISIEKDIEGEGFLENSSQEDSRSFEGEGNSSNVSSIMLKNNTPRTIEFQVILNPNIQTASSSNAVPEPQRMSAEQFMDQFRTYFREQLSSDIVRHARYIFRGGDTGEVSLVLKPEQFGRVRIKLHLENKRVGGKIIVENKHVMSAFENIIEELREAFLEQGFEYTNLALEFESLENEVNYITQTRPDLHWNEHNADNSDIIHFIDRIQPHIRAFDEVNIIV